MTGLTGPQGHQDWVRTSQVALTPIVQGPGIDMTKVNTLGPFYVGNAACLSVFAILADNLGPAQCVFEYGDDQNLTNGTGLPVIVLPPAGLAMRVTDMVPVLGNFVAISLPDALGAGLLELNVTPLCLPLAGARAGVNPMMSANAFTTAGGATTTKGSDVLLAGPATLAMSTDLADWAMLAEAMAADGNWYTIGYLDAMSGALGGTVALDLPHAPTRTSYINRGGSTATVSMSLVARAS